MLGVIKLGGRVGFKHGFFDFQAGVPFTCLHKLFDKHLLSTFVGDDVRCKGQDPEGLYCSEAAHSLHSRRADASTNPYSAMWLHDLVCKT